MTGYALFMTQNPGPVKHADHFCAPVLLVQFREGGARRGQHIAGRRPKNMLNDDVDHPYRPPARSTGTRSFPARSKASARGFLLAKLPAEDHWRQIIFESNLERQTALMLLARPDIWNLRDQPPSVTFTDPSGRLAHHTFDYLAQFKCGRRVAIAVKPAARVERIGFRQTLECVRNAVPLAFAADVVLVTERDLPRAEVQNAELLHMFRQDVDEGADRIVAKILAQAWKVRTIGEVVAESGLEGRGYRALFRAIYSGLVRADTREAITTATLLSRGEGSI